MKILLNVCLMFILSTTLLKANEKDDETFAVTPSFCIVDQDEHCAEQFNFDWHLKQVEDVCVIREKNEEQLVCMPQSKDGSSEIQLELIETEDFELMLKDTESSMTASVKVHEVGKDVRRLKKRLWSIF